MLLALSFKHFLLPLGKKITNSFAWHTEFLNILATTYLSNCILHNFQVKTNLTMFLVLATMHH